MTYTPCDTLRESAYQHNKKIFFPANLMAHPTHAAGNGAWGNSCENAAEENMTRACGGMNVWGIGTACLDLVLKNCEGELNPDGKTLSKDELYPLCRNPEILESPDKMKFTDSTTVQ